MRSLHKSGKETRTHCVRFTISQRSKEPVVSFEVEGRYQSMGATIVTVKTRSCSHGLCLICLESPSNDNERSL